MENNKKSVFETLSAINVNSMVEKKQTGNTMLTYLSWASAWAVAKANFPDIEYEIERNPETNLPYWYDPLTGYMVFTKITLGVQTHEMWLPVMDGTNHAMKAEPYEVQTKYKKFTVQAATMTDINKTIMRCLVKNLSIFGLGLYIYRGEDLPSSVEHSYPIQAQPAQPVKPVEKATQPQAPALQQAPVKDTRPVTAEMVDIIRKIVREQGVTGDFICESYKVCKLEDLRIYQFNHIKQNIEKLKTMFDAKRKKRLADVVKNADITVDPAAVKPKDMGTTFGDAILSQQTQEKNEGEEVSLESLGLSPEEMEALIECGDVFS